MADQNMPLEPVVYQRAGQIFANSRDVAAYFQKDHRNVIRDIKGLLKSEHTPSSYFQNATWVNPQNDQAYPAYDMTRDGFMLLVMQYTGERAMPLKIRYIQKFNEMEAALKTQSTDLTDIARTLADSQARQDALMERLDGRAEEAREMAQKTWQGQEEIKGRVGAIEEKVEALYNSVPKRRRRPSQKVKDELLLDAHALGGLCPCCSQNRVIDPQTGGRALTTEIDHFYEVSKADADHCWPICGPCHNGLTRGHRQRKDAEAHFRSFQEKRKALPGKQQKLAI